MPKRAWCSGCRGYVMLTPEDMCPYGHPKPSLRGVEEVGYGAPPSEPEFRPPDATPITAATATYMPSTATSSSGSYGATTYGADATSGFGGYSPGGGGASSARYTAAQAMDGFSAPAPSGAYGMPGPYDMTPSANPWQNDPMGIDPMLQIQLNKDATRMNRDVPWTETWVGIIIMLLILWPAGLIFLWRSSIPTLTHKWIITGSIGGLIVFNLIRASLMFSAAASRMPVPAVHP